MHITKKAVGRMLSQQEIVQQLGNYDFSKAKIGMVASHSALDVCDGSKDEGFPTVAFTQKGRERTYSEYFRSRYDAAGNLVSGMVDEVVVYDKFRDILADEEQQRIIDENILFIPNRSFTSYVDMGLIEDTFRVPMFGNRSMLRSEEREEEKNYYWLLEKAGLPFPERIEDPADIDSLCIVKLHHAVKKLERGFFTASSTAEYHEKAQLLLKQGIITEDALETGRIERYVIGPVFNMDMFYSPIETMGPKLELIGIDWRFETSLDGHVRLPAPQQMELLESQKWPEYTVCGHNSATLRESLLEKAFNLGEIFVEAAKEHYAPGVIGPFCLQTCVDKDLNFYIYDVAPRVGGGTNVHMSVGHPYGNALWRKPMSTGRRIAMEVRRAIDTDQVAEVFW
jgi:5-formaminoimidazole-4-carboxamide-1-(beta)-D-ribofuranosyl 5'-monophosphate synthetase